MGDSESALEDFGAAINIEPAVGQYFRNRGVLYDLLGKSERSASDFEIAGSVGSLAVPPLSERNLAYFNPYKGT